jgi:hypothetical protein
VRCSCTTMTMLRVDLCRLEYLRLHLVATSSSKAGALALGQGLGLGRPPTNARCQDGSPAPAGVLSFVANAALVEEQVGVGGAW